MRGAGTDSNVFMTLYGDKGKTDEVPLGNATDNFEQGQLDKFKVCQIVLSQLKFTGISYYNHKFPEINVTIT